MRAVIPLALCGLLLACGGPAPQRTLYLLRGPVNAQHGRLEAPRAIGLGPLRVASYLDQPGLVIETEGRQVQPARLHNWAEPLDEGLRHLLGAELARALGYPLLGDSMPRSAWDYAVDVQVERLHGTMGGEAVLGARYRITPATGAAAEFGFTQTAALPSEGYAGLVDAEAALVASLADAIARSLQELGSGAAAP